MEEIRSLEETLADAYDEFTTKHFSDADNVAKAAAIECGRVGAKWKEEEFERNRLTYIERLTEEEVERELDFIESYIEEHHCIPTYSAAIEYGRKLAKEENKKVFEYINMKDFRDAYFAWYDSNNDKSPLFVWKAACLWA